MRTNWIKLLLALVFISGCATSGRAYMFEESTKYAGHVINRKGVIIPEYTIGRDNQAPKDLELAKKRFRRRKNMVDKYYKRMEVIVDTNVEMAKTMGGMITEPFVLPFKVVDYNRYRDDPEYRKQVDAAEALEEEAERQRIEALKQELAVWIKEDLDREEPLE